MKNLMGKTRPIDNPYEVWVAGNWTWKVLKKYQADDHKPYARWFCQVITPYTTESGDMGDTYAADVMAVARLVETNYPEGYPNG